MLYGPDMPLVLHGGSGIPQDQIEKAYLNGYLKSKMLTRIPIIICCSYS